MILSFIVGLYLGIGIGYAFFILAEIGIGAGKRLLWRVPSLIIFWPALFLLFLLSLPAR